MKDLISNTFWVGTASALAAAFVLWLVNRIYKYMFRGYLSRAERLKIELKEHRREQGNLGAVALRELLFFILQSLTVTVICASLFTRALEKALTLATSEKALQGEDFIPVFYDLTVLLGVLAVSLSILFVFNLVRIVMLIQFADWREKHLINQIQEIEPSWKDPQSNS